MQLSGLNTITVKRFFERVQFGVESEYRTRIVLNYTMEERNGAIRPKCAEQKGACIAGKEK